jgi:hypothetical protein
MQTFRILWPALVGVVSHRLSLLHDNSAINNVDLSSARELARFSTIECFAIQQHLPARLVSIRLEPRFGTGRLAPSRRVQKDHQYDG